MTIVPVAPPQRVPAPTGFGSLAVDAQRRRVFVAHAGSRALLVLDADTGAVLADVHVGEASGVAVDPLGGHAFVGTGEGELLEVDAGAKRVFRSLALGAPVGAVAYDARLGRVYADAAGGTTLWVVDARSFRLVATVRLPGHALGDLTVDPLTHDVYQSIGDEAEIAVVDPRSDTVRATFVTPGLLTDASLRFDPAFGELVAVAKDGALGVYDRAGTQRARIAVPRGIDGCDLDAERHLLACDRDGELTLIQLAEDAAPSVLESARIAAGEAALAIDPVTHHVWAVWSDPGGDGDDVGRFAVMTSP